MYHTGWGYSYWYKWTSDTLSFWRFFIPFAPRMHQVGGTTKKMNSVWYYMYTKFMKIESRHYSECHPKLSWFLLSFLIYFHNLTVFYENVIFIYKDFIFRFFFHNTIYQFHQKFRENDFTKKDGNSRLINWLLVFFFNHAYCKLLCFVVQNAKKLQDKNNVCTTLVKHQNIYNFMEKLYF